MCKNSSWWLLWRGWGRTMTYNDAVKHCKTDKLLMCSILNLTSSFYVTLIILGNIDRQWEGRFSYLVVYKNNCIVWKTLLFPTLKQPQTTNNFNQRKQTLVTYFNSLVPASKALFTMWVYFAFASGDLSLNVKILPTVTVFKLSLSFAELTT